jgi:lipoprotein-anchoring transpeptidase ErfK/SrfK
MSVLNRRAFVKALTIGGTFGLVGCMRRQPQIAEIAVDYRRTDVPYSTDETPGTIVVDPGDHFLYLVQPAGRALRYGAGVGGEGFGWSGIARVHHKSEWPDWHPTAETLQRRPQLEPFMSKLSSGSGLVGGYANPLGARALYLWQGNKDTLYRIHGTNEPWTIGMDVSAGCIRLRNEDVIDLYNRVPVGAKVVVLPVNKG